MSHHLLNLTIASLAIIPLSDSQFSADVLLENKTTPPQISLLKKTQLNRDISIVQSLKPLIARQTQVATNPSEIVRQITVRILTNPGTGSGVIVARHGQKYTILTNNHVVDNTRNSQYMVLTADGHTHPAKRIQSLRLVTPILYFWGSRFMLLVFPTGIGGILIRLKALVIGD